ncbi:ABC transporter substrate-binding protein [Mitsuaria sp. TWR114]|jgi:branched-chain amino acid transport system substrate-binding protein|uniref:ABC transporter substrate-binding protein n=2 Tax=unclassified Roseateles TaxID=2626991 RepID=UPI0008E77BCB|nr:branched-chain amino acid transport system substrate-binding protein [Mitsuaria sp. BK037]MBB3296217.1 branched-chain amino acid transport system substrate-binding protein [Mitsuaria sp. BK041]MBB3365432.1 branched-chain amino acid transport system substrate-binding protein [Mitsuaria sp. BK045]TXD92721.1 ABC transporter substrate-binding protein [Mitsuaria sp. TWR114]SFR95285.1 amino acid/amide ABC transporter substrate-binding protein, HAAT family [Mitsuaria sp. PDC51]
MMFSARWITATALAAASFAALAADPIKIGVSGPFTGGSSSMGVSMRDGVRLAAQEINKNGGVLGRQIQLVERDDEAKNERGVQIAQELINREKVVATVGFINTGVALAAQRFYQDAKIPVMNNVATGSVITQQFKDQPENYVFRNAAHDSIQAPMIVEEAITRRGFKKVAILADSTNYGQLGRADLEKALELKGIKPVAVEKFNIKDVDMTAQLLKAKEAGAEAILTYGIGPELAQIANGMTKLGWKVPMVGSWTLSMANYIDNAGPGGEGARMPQTFIQEPTTPKRQSFIVNYLKTFNPKNSRIDSPVSAAQGYDSIYLLAAAIKQAGSTEGPKVKAALEDLKAPVEGVVTTYNKPFTKTDHEAITANIPVFGEVKGQRVVYAYEADFKAASEVKVKDVNAKGALTQKK